MSLGAIDMRHVTNPATPDLAGAPVQQGSEQRWNSYDFLVRLSPISRACRLGDGFRTGAVSLKFYRYFYSNDPARTLSFRSMTTNSAVLYALSTDSRTIGSSSRKIEPPNHNEPSRLVNRIPEADRIYFLKRRTLLV